MKLRRRAVSLLLTMAMMFTFMPFMTQTANAAGNKVQLVAKQTDDNGNTTKYSYNKKGLVSKAVTKSSSKGKGEDVANTTTSKYTYNKKNRVKKITTKNVTSMTSYKTDKTTGARAASTGTVTDTWNTVTTFKTNKKGLATQSVSTTNFTKSGRSTSIRTYLTDFEGEFDKTNDGRYFREEWDSVSGTYVTKFYTAAEVAAFAKTSGNTTTYTDNGNGTYTTVIEEIGATPSDPVTSKSQAVTTTKYSHDKKKRVKKKTVTVVRTTESLTTYAAGGSKKTVKTITECPYTVAYKYDKKGHIKKETFNNPNTESIEDSITTNVSASGVTTVTTVHKAGGTITRTRTENGVDKTAEYAEAVKSWWPDYASEKYEVPKTYPIKSTVTNKYDKNGNLKSSKGSEVTTDDKTIWDSTYDNVIVYLINADGTFVVDEEGYRITQKTPVSTATKFTEKVSNILKKGTKAILNRVGMRSSSTDGYADGTKGSYSMGQTKFKLKAKGVKAKLRKDVELQQWAIQNGVFSGRAGL